MSHRRNCLHLVAAVAILVLWADDMAAAPRGRPNLPIPGGFGKGGGARRPAARAGQRPRRGRGNAPKPVDPLTVAVKDLQAAEKDVESNHKNATQMTQAAEQIVHNQELGIRQARQQALENTNVPKNVRDMMKARADALASVLKDIRTAKKELAARKTIEAKAALAAAITGLEALTDKGNAKDGGEKKKKKA